MKNLKIKLGLFSLLAVLAASVFFTSCEQEMLTSEQILDTEFLESEPKTYMLEVPDGLTGEAAIEWAREQPIEQYIEISNEESATITIESRSCTYEEVGTGFRGTCICLGPGPSQGKRECFRYCDIYMEYCGGWSGPHFFMQIQEVARNCSC